MAALSSGAAELPTLDIDVGCDLSIGDVVFTLLQVEARLTPYTHRGEGC